MFKCQKCNKISNIYEKQNTIIIEKREKSYHYYVIKVRLGRGKTKQIITQTAPDKRDPNKQIVKEFNTKGWEIVRELKVCKECIK